MRETTPTIVAAIDDLFFTVQVQGALRKAGAKVVFAQQESAILSHVRTKPLAVVVDLNARSFDAIALIRAIRSDLLSHALPILAFVSHVQLERRAAAKEAGANEVVARSALVQTLPGWVASLG
jgi:CheY-like chemotaxis protein